MTKENRSENNEPESSPAPTPKPKPTSKKKSTKLDSDDSKYKLIRAALEEHLVEHARRHDKKKRSLDEVTAHVEEFMDSFIIIGYDYGGEPVTLISANTQQQADSLSTAIQKFIVNSQTGAPPGGFFE
ncbi:hypothetical protein N9033_00305 [bacterium]|nr:hypothetical protein [bacterium]